MSVSQEYLEQELKQPSLFARLSLYDWLWAALVLLGAGYVFTEYRGVMNAFELTILALTAPSLVLFGWGWKSMRTYTLVVAAISLLAIGLYGGVIDRQDTNFFLKFLISSKSAIMWMSALFVMATAAYYLGLALRSPFTEKVGSALTWSASTMGLVGLMVRWRESYLLGDDIGHIPVSNLYEVFILFAVITGLLYLFYEQRYRTRAMGAFVLTVISASVGFLLWYTFDRGADEIQPLVPALQSYWMKIHVPANFIGYGAFALAAMVGVAYLTHEYVGTRIGRIIYYILSALVVAGAAAGSLYLWQADFIASPRVAGIVFGASTVLWFAMAWGITRKSALERFFTREQMDDIMYKSIALGFAFFTVATVLGAMWAAEAWGGYWSWDPKETWALIVWLNYAAWLHLRLTKGWRGRPLAWWAIVGLFITLFAFLGVNMFLSGLHSYGEL